MCASTELDNIRGFDHYDALFRIGNKYFKGDVSAAINRKGRLFHDVTKIENVTKDTTDQYGEHPYVSFLSDTSMSTAETADVDFPADHGTAHDKRIASNADSVKGEERQSLKNQTQAEAERIREQIATMSRFGEEGKRRSELVGRLPFCKDTAPCRGCNHPSSAQHSREED